MSGHEPSSDISSTVDGLFGGCFIDSILLGVTLVQAWSYFCKNKDGWTMQAFVMLLLFVDITETIAIILALRDYLVLRFGDYNYLMTFDPLVPLGLLSTYLIFFMTHAFFTKTVYSVCRRKWLLVLNITLCALMLGFGLAASLSIWWPRWLKTPRQRNMAGLISHILAGTSDVVIAVRLTLSLSDYGCLAKKHLTGGTKELLHRVLVFTVSRGIVMTIAQFVHVGVYLSNLYHPLLWAGTHFLISKLYVLTTLVSLNARRSFSHKCYEVYDEELPSMSFASRPSADLQEEIDKASTRSGRATPAFA